MYNNIGETVFWHRWILLERDFWVLTGIESCFLDPLPFFSFYFSPLAVSFALIIDQLGVWCWKASTPFSCFLALTTENISIYVQPNYVFLFSFNIETWQLHLAAAAVSMLSSGEDAQHLMFSHLTLSDYWINLFSVVAKIYSTVN